MIQLREVSRNGIEKLANQRESLDEFSKELQSHKNKIADLKAEQENKFDFERGNQLNALTQTLEQAQSVYNGMKAELENILKASHNTEMRIQEDVLNELNQDEELTQQSNEIIEKVIDLRKQAEQFKSLVTKKKFKLVDEIEETTATDISELLGRAEGISPNQFIAINSLIQLIDQYSSVANLSIKDE